MKIRRVAVAFVLALSLQWASAQQLNPAGPGAHVDNNPQAIFAAKAGAQDAEYMSWIGDVQSALVAGQFDDLDRQADELRQGKVRWPGGGWKLVSFYAALDAPSGPDGGTEDHLARLERWVKLRPESITARVALAGSLVRWAWVARGNEASNDVPKDAFPLFFQRLTRAREVLDSAAGMRTMCPEWYRVMLVLGRSQQWNRKQMEEVLARGQQFAPD